MTRHPTFTEAEIARAVKAARATDPTATVEIVTAKGVIRIKPAEPVDTPPAAVQPAPKQWAKG